MTLRSLLPFGQTTSQSLVSQTEGAPFFSLHRDIDRAIDEMFHNFGRFGTSLETVAFTPHLDVSEDDNNYMVAVELPGMDEKDIDLEIKDGNLLIRGEKKFERDEKRKGGYHLVERSYGSFLRTVPLSFDVEPDAIEAVYKKGVLKITVPKPEGMDLKARKIEIH